MILDTARLLLFPALMAFAAASDLFTMTISNRVSLALIAGFTALAVLGGMGLHDILLHFGAGAAVLVVAFGCFAMGWVGGGDAKVAASVALWARPRRADRLSADRMDQGDRPRSPRDALIQRR